MALAAGHLLDLWSCGHLTSVLTRVQLSAGGNKVAAPGRAFMHLTFSGLGAISAAQGGVRRIHMEYMKSLLKRLGLADTAATNAMKWFIEGTAPALDLPALLAPCSKTHSRAPIMASLALESFCVCAQLSDGPTRKQLAMLSCIAQALGISERRLAMLMRELAPIARQFHSPGTSAEAVLDSLSAAFELFDLNPGASSAQITQAYRRFAARHHPDRLPPDSAEAARRKSEGLMQQAQDARELLQALH
jgi:DnaJ-domain-containing protein 1